MRKINKFIAVVFLVLGLMTITTVNAAGEAVTALAGKIYKVEEDNTLVYIVRFSEDGGSATAENSTGASATGLGQNNWGQISYSLTGDFTLSFIYDSFSGIFDNAGRKYKEDASASFDTSAGGDNGNTDVTSGISENYYLAAVNFNLKVAKYYDSRTGKFQSDTNTNALVNELTYNETDDVWSFKLGTIEYEIVYGNKELFPLFKNGNKNTFVVKCLADNKYYNPTKNGTIYQFASAPSAEQCLQYVNASNDLALILVDASGNILDIANEKTEMVYQVSTDNTKLRVICKVSETESVLQKSYADFKLTIDGVTKTIAISHYYTDVTTPDMLFEASTGTYYFVLVINNINNQKFVGKTLNINLVYTNNISRQLTINM